MADLQPERSNVLIPPPRLDIRDTRYQLEISFRWFTSQGGRLLGGLSLFWTVLLIAGFLFLPEDFSVVWMFFGLAEIGFIYYTAALFLNRTTVTLTQENLHVNHGPIPVRESKSFPREAIQRIYSQPGTGGENMPNIFITTRDNGDVCLLERLENTDEARFIVSELAGRLGIE